MATKRFGDITGRAEAEVIAKKRESYEQKMQMQLRRREEA